MKYNILISALLLLCVYALFYQNSDFTNSIKELEKVNKDLLIKNDSILFEVETRKKVIKERDLKIDSIKSERDSLEIRLNKTYVYYEKQLNKVNNFSDTEHVEYFGEWSR